MTVEGKVPQNNINRHLGVLRNCEIMKLESLDIQQHIKGKIQQREKCIFIFSRQKEAKREGNSEKLKGKDKYL